MRDPLPEKIRSLAFFSQEHSKNTTYIEKHRNPDPQYIVRSKPIPHNLAYVNSKNIHLGNFGIFYKKTKLFIVTYVAFRDGRCYNKHRNI